MQMYEAIRPMFPSGEYALMPQVRNGTGFTKTKTRTADAIALSLWPSRGIDLIGFEFKDSRADVLKELGDSSKSDEIGKHCAQWWLVVSDAKYISKDELPSAWGLIAIKDGVAKKTVQAVRRIVEKPDLPLIAAIMKAASGSVTGEDDVQRRINAAVTKEQDRIHKWHEEQKKRDQDHAILARSNLQAAYVKFKEESGIDIMHDYRWSRKLGEVVKFILDGGLNDLTHVVRWCRDTADEVEQLIEGQP